MPKGESDRLYTIKSRSGEETASLFAQEIISRYVLVLINKEQVMLTGQFLARFVV